MEDRYLISFKIFSQRTGFSLKSYIKNNQSCNYEDFCDILRKKNIEPIDIEYFNKIKEIVKQEDKTLEESKILEKEKQVKKTKSTKKPVEQSPKRRRKRSRVKND